MAEEKAAVPKFASFRPKQPPQPVAQTRKTSEEDESQKHRDKQRSHRRERSRDRKHRHDDERRRYRDRSRDTHDKSKAKSASDREALVVPDAKAISRELFDNASNVYRVDTKGDPDNLRYRKLHSYGVPGYKRIGYGAVVGAPRDQRIDRSFPEDKGIILVARDRESRSTRSLLQKARPAEQRKLRLVRPEGEGTIIGGDNEHKLSFIELPRGRKRKRREESPIQEQGEVDYRSIEGKAKAGTQPEDSDVEYASSSDDAEEDEGRATRLQNAALSKRTRDQPQDIEAWMKLIDFQRDVLGYGTGELSHAKTRTLADIRISIYEQALVVMKDSGARAQLTLGMLEEGARFWESKKLSSQWEQALRVFSSDADIWTAYLSFIQSSHAEFRYERCRDEYVKCLGILAKAVRDARGTTQAKKTSRILVYVFLRLTSMMRDAGYHEFAMALWQAVLELHFFRPSSLQSEKQIMEAFEKFWEEEVPRIGEEGARGLASFQPDEQEAPDPVTIEVQTVTSTRKLFTRFAEAERTMAKRFAMPGRSADEAGEDDPYHVVLFNDLSSILFPAILEVEEKRDLIVAFLRFANLPPLPDISDRMYEKWWLDPMLSWTECEDVLIEHYQISTETLFNDAFAELSSESMQWIRSVIATLVNACPENEALAEYHIALEFKLDPTNAAKFAKRLLKTRSSSLRLYNCYAIIESRNKGLESGARIFSTAVSMSTSFSEEEQRNEILLYRTWVWEALRVDDVRAATGVLLSIGGDVKDADTASFSPAVELRVTRWLQEGRDGMFSAGEPQLAVLHVGLLALLSYFKNVRSIEAALDVYETSETLLTSRNLAGSPAHALLHQAKAQLITFHLEHVHLYKPSLLRATLAKSITLFPDNTILLSAHYDLGSDLNLLTAHSILEDNVLAPANATVIGYSFVLSTALKRSVEMGGTPHLIRALFSRATSPSAPGAHNIHLWTCWLHFEAVVQRDYNKAREVFMRGLRELPWSKWWIVRGLEVLGDVVGFEEGRRIWKVLGEREMRVVVDVEELVEEEWERRVAEREGRTIE